MSKFKFNPGPWSIGNAVDHNAVAVFPASTPAGVYGDAVCLISKIEDFTEMDQANANLISAAPDMLTALIELRDYYKDMTGLPAAKANAAINKALGK